MVTQDQVRKYVDEIMEKTGLKQFEVSEQAGYGKKSLGQLISKGIGMDGVYAQLKLAFAERLKNSPKPEDNEPTAKEILLEMAKGRTAHEQSYDTLARIIERQTQILELIKKDMARGEALANVAKNVQRVLGGLEAVADKQTKAIREVRSDLKEIKTQRKVPS